MLENPKWKRTRNDGESNLEGKPRGDWNTSVSTEDDPGPSLRQTKCPEEPRTN